MPFFSSARVGVPRGPAGSLLYSAVPCAPVPRGEGTTIGALEPLRRPRWRPNNHRYCRTFRAGAPSAPPFGRHDQLECLGIYRGLSTPRVGVPRGPAGVALYRTAPAHRCAERAPRSARWSPFGALDGAPQNRLYCRTFTARAPSAPLFGHHDQLEMPSSSRRVGVPGGRRGRSVQHGALRTGAVRRGLHDRLGGAPVGALRWRPRTTAIAGTFRVRAPSAPPFRHHDQLECLKHVPVSSARRDSNLKSGSELVVHFADRCPGDPLAVHHPPRLSPAVAMVTRPPEHAHGSSLARA